MVVDIFFFVFFRLSCFLFCLSSVWSCICASKEKRDDILRYFLNYSASIDGNVYIDHRWPLALRFIVPFDKERKKQSKQTIKTNKTNKHHHYFSVIDLLHFFFFFFLFFYLSFFFSLALLPSDDVHFEDEKCEIYHFLRTIAGLPEGPAEIPQDKAITFESNMDVLGGIHFDKGCYIGQEPIARVHFTGMVRKRLVPVILSSPSPTSSLVTSSRKTAITDSILFHDQDYLETMPSFPSPGTNLVSYSSGDGEGEKSIGKIVSWTQPNRVEGEKEGGMDDKFQVGFAMMRLEHLEKAGNFETDESAIVVTKEKKEGEGEKKFLKVIRPVWWHEYLKLVEKKKEKEEAMNNNQEE